MDKEIWAKIRRGSQWEDGSNAEFLWVLLRITSSEVFDCRQDLPDPLIGLTFPTLIAGAGPRGVGKEAEKLPQTTLLPQERKQPLPQWKRPGPLNETNYEHHVLTDKTKTSGSFGQNGLTSVIIIIIVVLFHLPFIRKYSRQHACYSISTARTIH